MSERDKVMLKPAYLILGEEVLVKMEVEKIKKAFDESVLEFGFDAFEAAQVTAREIVSMANTPPFMAEHRLILVRNVDKMAQQEIKELVEYLKNPSGTTCLVLIGEAMNEKSELLKVVRNVGEVMRRDLERGKLPAMVKTAFRKRGQVVSDSLVAYLISAAGEDLAKLGNEIEKASLYCMGRKVVELQEARRVISSSDEIRVFEITDRLGRRDVQGALKALEQIVQDGFERKYRGKDVRSADFRMVSKEEHARSILALIVNHFRALLRLKSLLDEGAGKAEIFDKLGLKGPESTKNFLFTKYRRQVDSFSLAGLEKAPSLFVKADLDIKMSGQPPELVLERLMVQLAASR